MRGPGDVHRENGVHCVALDATPSQHVHLCQFRGDAVNPWDVICPGNLVPLLMGKSSWANTRVDKLCFGLLVLVCYSFFTTFIKLSKCYLLTFK